MLSEALRPPSWSTDKNKFLQTCLCVDLVASVMSDSETPWNEDPPGSTVHGIFQARLLEWVAVSFSRGSSQLRD